MVKDVEELSPEFQVAALGEPRFLEYREIHVAEIRTKDCVAPAIAECSCRWYRKGRGIQPVRDALRAGVRIHAGYAIRPLVNEVAVAEGVRSDVHGIRESGANDPKGRNMPAGSQLASETGTEQPVAASQGHVVQQVEREVVTDVA